MSAHYSFRVDRTRGLVRIAMGGFFSHDDIAGLREARRKAHRALGCAPNAHVTLGDLRGMKIQAPDIVEAFRELLGESDYRPRRLAVILGETLFQGQARRALAGRDGAGGGAGGGEGTGGGEATGGGGGEARCFTDPIAAEAWLFGADRDGGWRTANGLAVGPWRRRVSRDAPSRVARGGTG